MMVPSPPPAGYNKIVVDPQVRLAYNIRDFRDVRKQGPGMRLDVAKIGTGTGPKFPVGINMAAQETTRAR